MIHLQDLFVCRTPNDNQKYGMNCDHVNQFSFRALLSYPQSLPSIITSPQHFRRGLSGRFGSDEDEANNQAGSQMYCTLHNDIT